MLRRKTVRRGGRPTTSISSPNHILVIFSSEPYQNPRPFNISVRSLKINTFLKNMGIDERPNFPHGTTRKNSMVFTIVNKKD